MTDLEPIVIHVGNAGLMTGPGNNTYLLAPGDGPACLIDAGTGTVAHVAAVREHVARQRGVLTDVLVTHGHVDHASGAPALRAAFSRAVFSKYPWPGHDDVAVPWRTLADGEVLDVGGTSLTIVHTPGHSPDHVVFWHDGTKTVFSGDLVTREGTVVIGWSRQGDLSAYLASLQRIIELRPSRLLPGHGPAVDDPIPLLRRTLEHRLRRESQVLAAVAGGRYTVPAIGDSIYDGLESALLPLAYDTVRAHLEKLKTDGRVAYVDGLWRPAV